MKKIAIVTIESMNYGNRLQNYALQTVLQSMGFSVKTLHRVNCTKNLKYYMKRLAQYILQTKALKFHQFDHNIDFSDIAIGKDTYPADLKTQFDFFIAGSDQIWNPHYNFVAGKCDFLAFADDRQKISYAASFGVNEIPEERKKEFSEYLKTFKAISVREKQGVEIIKNLCTNDVNVVLDPTLLLNQEMWSKVERNSQVGKKKKYILVYALGEKSDRFTERITDLGEEYEIIDLRAKQKNGKQLSVGPSEFLSLIKNAEMILTDSFHATVFSIIYCKKFITFNRTGLNMNSRIESLADLLDVGEHINEFGDFVCEEEMNYSEIEKKLETERVKSIEFIKKALDLKN